MHTTRCSGLLYYKCLGHDMLTLQQLECFVVHTIGYCKLECRPTPSPIKCATPMGPVREPAAYYITSNETTTVLVLTPDPILKEEKGSGDLRAKSLVQPY